MANTKLTWTPSQNGTRTKFTFSFWVKRTGLSSGQSPIYSADISDSNNTYSMIYFVNDVLAFYSTDNGQTLYFLTNQKFRDVNSWYHIVIAIDTTQATASNRVKFYVNGEQITSFDTASYPNQNIDNTWFNVTQQQVIGTRSYDNNTYFDGVISHFNFIDGTQYAASDFGSTDATTGEWKINTSPNVNYGTNGFFILKDGNSVTDSSPNSNNWTVAGGTLTKTEDNPSNVFATLNSLVNGDGSYSLTNGSNKFTGTGGNDHTFGTLGAIGGKFYYETKWVTNPDRCYAGFIPGELAHTLNTSEPPTNYFAGLYRDDYFMNVGNVNEGAYTNVSAGDIFGFAIDLSSSSGSRTLKTYKNGSLINTMTLSTSYENDTWLPVLGDTSSTNGVIECNFGNGYFGTTAVSSAGTNASGNGIFEYDVPTGYTALSTKGLNL
mgnify:CR=1 FL=1